MYQVMWGRSDGMRAEPQVLQLHAPPPFSASKIGAIEQAPLMTTYSTPTVIAVFDDPRNGSNGKGRIDPGDAINSRPRLWVDQNQNGVGEPSSACKTLRRCS
jgi:hypothetical protein